MRKMLGIVLLAATAGAAGHAASKPTAAPAILAESERTAASEFSIQASLPQAQLETTIDAGRVARPPSGGILDTLIVYSLDDKKKKIEWTLREKAEGMATPIRRSLNGFDVDTLARDATQSSLVKPGWLKFQGVIFNKESNLQSRAAFIEGSPATRAATLVYRYEMAPDFSHVRVIAELALARKTIGKDGKPLGGHTTIYRQNLMSIAQLKTRSFENSENAAKWAADDGRLIKAGLTAAFARFEKLVPYALALSANDIKALTSKTREKAFAAGFYGGLIERAADGSGDVTFWADGPIHVQTLPQS